MNAVGEFDEQGMAEVGRAKTRARDASVMIQVLVVVDPGRVGSVRQALTTPSESFRASTPLATTLMERTYIQNKR